MNEYGAEGKRPMQGEGVVREEKGGILGRGTNSGQDKEGRTSGREGGICKLLRKLNSIEWILKTNTLWWRELSWLCGHRSVKAWYSASSRNIRVHTQIKQISHMRRGAQNSKNEAGLPPKISCQKIK